MIQKIVSQRLLANGVLQIGLGPDQNIGGFIFAHAGGSNALVELFAIPNKRPDSTKSNYKIYHSTVAAGTTEVFKIQDIELSFSDYTLEVETDSNGAGQIMLTVLGT